jgi:hypothetical protein
MSYLVKCSFGEIIDKYTILKIKLEKVQNIVQRNNIETEFSALKKWVTITDNLFEELYKINSKLWNLEDNIREKSKIQEFDREYIDFAESIHKVNDQRYQIKRQINEKYNSEIIEEKLHKSLSTTPENNTQNIADLKLLDLAQEYFALNKILDSAKILRDLVVKYNTCDDINDFIAKLFICNNCVREFIGEEPQFLDKLDTYIVAANYNKIFITDPNAKEHFYRMYCFSLLRNREYKKAGPYMKYMNIVRGPNVSPDTTSIDIPKDGKTILLYSGGGIGDKIMFGRFIPQFCKVHSTSTILFLIDDGLIWIFLDIFSNITNLKIIKYSDRQSLPDFKYHLNITQLFYSLKLNADDIYTNHYLNDVSESTINLDNIINADKFNVIINWHGSYLNSHELSNRGISLEQLTSVCDISNINWISIQKEVKQKDVDILSKNNIINLADNIDNEFIYKDTITILKNVDLVISTDTSLLHIAGTLNIPSIALLTVGCEWRWQNKCWYPNIKQLKQKSFMQWDPVIQELRSLIIENRNRNRM